MSTIIQTGIQSCQDLGVEFLSTILGSGPSGQTSVVCGVVYDTGNVSSGTTPQTTFYLNNPLLWNEYSDPCAGSDWVVIAILAVLVHCVSWWTRWLVWEPLANKRMQGHKTWDEMECKRFSTTCTSALFFCLSAFFASRILLPKDWLFQRFAWTQRGPIIDADFKFYYLLYAARFFSDSVSIFFEPRKMDAFIASLIHHMVTLGLVLGSAYVGHTRYGGIIMFFFDWADIPLLFAKICKYLSKTPEDAFQSVANRLFEFFAVLFFLTRNCYYNYVVFAAWSDLTNDWVNRGCQYLLLLLVVLQTYWMGLIIQAAMRQAKNGGNAADIRDDRAQSSDPKKKQ